MVLPPKKTFYKYVHRPLVALGFAGFLAAGCSPSRFLARRMTQAPNTYPTWFAPDALVTYSIPSALIRAFPARSLAVGPPEARVCYRVVEPADYQLKEDHSSWKEKGETHYSFRFQGVLPPNAERWRGSPRGTVLLLHGYSVDLDAMMPWALRLARSGWRSVVVDLRGHGHSTGDRVFFGTVETSDLRQLLDELDRETLLAPPLMVIGASYGAGIGLKLATEDARVEGVAAITPYARLETAILGIRQGYATWIPEGWIRGAANLLPELVGVPPGGLDPLQWVQKRPVHAWLAAGSADTIAPPGEVRELRAALAESSDYFETPNGIHETIPLQLNELAPEVERWLDSASATWASACQSDRIGVPHQPVNLGQ